MTDIRIGVVCEGKTDFAILEWSLRPALARHGLEARFHPIQPVRDKTSGSFGEAGWHPIYQWCLRNDTNARQRFFGGGLFQMEGSISVDLIIVQIDGDITDILRDHPKSGLLTSVPLPAANVEVQQRIEACERILREWLDGLPAAAPDKTVPVPVVLAGESWILSSSGRHENAETIADPKFAFAHLYCAHKNRPVQAGLRRLKHHHDCVEEYLGEVNPDIDVLTRCNLSFDRAVATIKDGAPAP